MGKPTKEEREAELWEHDRKVVERALGWFDMLIKLRRAAENVPADALMEQLRRADLDTMCSDNTQLMHVLFKRFLLGRAALEFSGAQSERGKKGLKKRWGDRDDIDTAIRELSARTDTLGDPLDNTELWSEFYSKLDEAGLRPQDSSGEVPRKEDRITWTGNSEGMTYKTFKNRIALARQ